MKKRVTRDALEQLILAEIDRSQRCPKGIGIRIEPGVEGSWTVIPLAQANSDPGCIKRIAAIAARFRVDFELTE
jgi:hypothetical protein